MLCCLLPLLCCMALSAKAEAPKVFLDRGAGNQVVVELGGKEKRLPKDNFEAKAVAHSKLLFVSTDEEAKEGFGLEPGLYIFDEAGKLVASVASDAASMCDTVELSPGGSILAMDSGGSLNRDWFFFSYPSMKPLEHESTSYYMVEGKPAVIWLDDQSVLLNTMEMETKRACEYDPCGPTSVVRYDLKTAKVTPIFPGTDLCDYSLTSFAGGTVTADKLCLKKVKDWKTFPENAPKTPVTAKLP